MCGIVVIFAGRDPINPDSLARATQRLVHRGPDEKHLWIAPHKRVGLGHTRLSIIDLQTGSQPIPSEDESLHIVVNGEFYDYERIRGELETRGHQFRTRTDSEIALHLYEDLNVKCLEQLRGEFAFAIGDENKQTVFAARIALESSRCSTRVTAAPLPGFRDQALIAAGVPAAWDHESVFQNLFLSVDQDRTLFRGIRQVPPGHYLEANAESLRLARYWDANYPRANARTIQQPEADCISQLRTLLDEAVRLRLRADVPVGCYLSGGVDSSSVLGMASVHARDKIAAFTIAFDHQDFDESASARNTAAHVGADFLPVAVTERDFADVFTAAVSQGETIHYNAHGAARYRLSRAVQQAGYKVVLAGEGADELFAGYDFSRAALLAGNNNGRFKWPRMLARMLRVGCEAEQRIVPVSPWLVRIFRVLDFPPALVEYVSEKLVLLQSLLAADFGEEFRNRDPYREFLRQFELRANLLGREPVKQILYLWMKSLFVNYVLAAERLDMAHAVELRLPFLDHKLFEFARSIPASLLAKNGQVKYVLREAVKPFVLDEVYRGAKQPFFAPPTTLRVGNPMYELLQDLLRSRSFSSVPFFDQSAVIEFLDELPGMNDSTRASMDPLLFMMASMGVLHDSYRL